jgi:hypothetical protein
VTRRTGGLVAAVVVAIALWLGAATPGLAAANESPSPPALATLIACNGVPSSASAAVDACPAIARGSSSAVHTRTARRFPLAPSGPVGALAVVAITTSVIALVAQWRRKAEGGPVGARAPPVLAS